uniref:MADF domain-containing protein n=1 Tax=Bombyx mori TaxID=7091 RepID=A0A8R2DNZ7_BOMMO|nr:uncharacterized protein LOC110386467 isoform X1 [Bombyx mori]
MSEENVVFPQKILKKFILLYKDLPCLWDKECPAYKIKMKRHDAITKMTELVQEYDPSATRVHILRKIESLRACVRREYKRVQESRRKANCEEEVYVPNLWYYDLLSFIFKNEAPEPARSPIPTAETEEEEDDDCQVFDSQSVDYSNDFNETGNMVEADDVSTISKRYLTFEPESTTSKVKRQFTEVEDEYDAIAGINVAAKLRYLPNNMRVLAEKLINDVLFQAQTNSLTSTTAIMTPDPFKSDAN